MTETLKFQIEGMTCGGCSGRVKGVLELNLNVESAEISHEENSGIVKKHKSTNMPKKLIILKN